MNYYIEVDEFGNTKNHPAMEDNLLQVFEEIPNNWEPFIDLSKPEPGPYQNIEGLETYVKVNGSWVRDYRLVDMTDDEKIEKQNAIKELWAKQFKLKSWTFNEELCWYEPPIPYPGDVNDPLSKVYTWNEDELNWIEIVPNQE
jgi:hypothetical protein